MNSKRWVSAIKMPVKQEILIIKNKNQEMEGIKNEGR
jgi:hypothetical protein